MQSLRQQIEALPEPERSARRAFYTDEEWKTSWELNAYPFQIEPPSDDWKIWTIIAGPRTGKSSAGIYWAWQKFFEKETNVLCLFHHRQAADEAFRQFSDHVSYQSHAIEVSQRATAGSITTFRDKTTGNHLYLLPEDQIQNGSTRGMILDYVWADEVTDAEAIVKEYPTAKRFLFTQPVMLHPDTLVSRAGDGRTY